MPRQLWLLGEKGTDAFSTKDSGGVQRDFLFTYTHYAGGALASIEYPSQRKVSYCYDSVFGRPSWVSAVRTSTDCQGTGGTGAVYANATGYFPHGAMETLTYGNGLVESANYNSRLQPTVLQLSGGLWKTEYEYHRPDPADPLKIVNNGNVLKQVLTMRKDAQTNVSIATTYSYDKANRLLVAAELPVDASVAPLCQASSIATNGWCQQFGYDRYGNRLISERLPATSVVNEPASFNPLNNRIADSGWTYAAGGARGEVETDPSGFTYSYDGESHMVQAVCPAGRTTCTAGTNTYLYDADGRRVRHDGTAGTTMFVYDAAGQLAAEYSTAGSTVAGVQCLTTDHLGSTRLVTDGAGTPAERHDYEPFGTELHRPAGSPRTGVPGYVDATNVKLQFTGKERDTDTGLDYFLARYYSGTQGRFTSPDIAGPRLADPQSFNKYAYTRNNPLRRVDPDGRYDIDVHFQLTHLLAIAAGYSNPKAWAIADANQRIDEDRSTEPTFGGNARRRKANADWHFPSKARLGQLASTTVKNLTLTSLGEYLHVFQDSFSHAGYTNMTWGHGLAIDNFWHPLNPWSVDYTSDRPELANEMAQETFQDLLSASGQLGAENAAVPWDVIAGGVDDFIHCRDNQCRNRSAKAVYTTILQWQLQQQFEKQEKERIEAYSTSK